MREVLEVILSTHGKEKENKMKSSEKIKVVVIGGLHHNTLLLEHWEKKVLHR